MSVDSPIPWPVVQRLPRYLTQVVVLRDEGVHWASSHVLGEALGLTTSTVRQDLSHLDLTGVSKRGYSTGALESVLRHELGSDHEHRMVVYGAGHLGSALLFHTQLRRHGFLPRGVVDPNPERVGKKMGRFVVRPVDSLRRMVQSRQVDVGVVAVRASVAQEAADNLVEAGVQGILNMAYTHLQVPDRISVVDVRILARLQELAYALRMQEKSAGAGDKPATVKRSGRR